MKYNKLTKLSYWFLLLIIIILYNCNSNQEDKQKGLIINIKENNKSPTKVVITGITDDPNAFKHFNLLNYSYLFAENHRDMSKKVVKDCLYLELDSLDQSGIMRIYAFGDSARYNLRIFVAPGDSISMKIKNKTVRFTGKNSEQYNFFNEIKSLNLEDSYFNGDLYDYKKRRKDIFDKQNEFFNHYLNKCKDVSNDFIEKIKADIRFKYLENLMFLNLKDKSDKKTVMDILIDESYPKADTKFYLNNYFNGITLEEFKRPDLLNNESFKKCLVNYIRHYFVENNFENYSNEKFIAEKNFILSNLKGELQHFAIASLINDYYKNLSLKNINDLILLIKEYKHNFSKSSYVKVIDKIENGLKITNNTLTEKVLNSKLINLEGDTLRVKNVLNGKSKIRVIDFWASWCSPCISEIKKGNSVRKKMAKTDDVEYIYFSIDKEKDREKWVSKSKELVKYGLDKKQYLVLDTKNSELVRYFGISSIPHYVIMNKEGKVIDGKAPRPSDSLNFQKIIDNINLINNSLF